MQVLKHESAEFVDFDGEYYLMPDNISGNERNFFARDGVKERRIEMMKAPDDISANKRNYVTRIILREMDETI